MTWSGQVLVLRLQSLFRGEGHGDLQVCGETLSSNDMQPSHTSYWQKVYLLCSLMFLPTDVEEPKSRAKCRIIKLALKSGFKVGIIAVVFSKVVY
jgi:hypothetical protein